MFTGSAQEKGFKCSIRIKGCDLVHLSVAVTAWPQLLCNTPFSLAFLAKMGSTMRAILHLHRNQQNPFWFVFIIQAGERGFLKNNGHFLKGKKHPCFISLKSGWSSKTYGHCVTQAGAGKEHRTQQQQQADSGTGGEELGPERHCHQPKMQTKTNPTVIFSIFTGFRTLYTTLCNAAWDRGCDMAGSTTPRGVSTRGSWGASRLTANGVCDR